MAKVMITLPDEMLKKVDRAASAEHRNRSELVREALRTYIANRAASKRASLLDNPGMRAAIALQDQSRRETRGVKFDSVAFIRKMRGPLK